MQESLKNLNQRFEKPVPENYKSAWEKSGSYSVINHFLKWYFADGPKLFSKMIQAILIRSYDNFSVEYLLKTFFAPWKRDVATGVNLSLQQKFQIWSWNLVSRFMGVAIRAITLIIGMLFLATLALILYLMYFLWFILPLIILWLLILGIFNIL